MKQILLTMNEKQSFIIEDLDDYNVVIKADEEYAVRRDLDIEVSLDSSSSNMIPMDAFQLEKNTYTLE